jgi:hypothetical protein
MASKKLSCIGLNVMASGSRPCAVGTALFFSRIAPVVALRVVGIVIAPLG